MTEDHEPRSDDSRQRRFRKWSPDRIAIHPLPFPRRFWRDIGWATGFAAVAMIIGVSRLWFSHTGFLSHPIESMAAIICVTVGAGIFLFTMYYVLVYLVRRYREGGNSE
jgi:hypothetical protein